MDFAASAARAVAGQEHLVASLFEELRKKTTVGKEIRRDAYGEGENFAHRLVAAAACDLGLEIEHDGALNTYMTLKGPDLSAPRVVVGSHLDFVADGGNFDGAAGVISGLAALAALKSAGFRPRSDITVMAIRAEESVWFSSTLFGSRAAMGDVPTGVLDDLKRVDTGKTLAQHIAECGGNVGELRAGKVYLNPKAIRAFIEIHIEQGPILDTEGIPVGIVIGVRGNSRRAAAKVYGEYSHCGGVPREYRRDSVVAASEFVHRLDQTWREWLKQQKDMAFTVGRFFTNPDQHALTKIPGEVTFSLDVRSVDPQLLDEIEHRVEQICAEIAVEKGVKIDLGPVIRSPVGLVATPILEGLSAGAKTLNIRHRLMASGASHDAAAFAHAGVPMGMIFVRNANGSHNPAEAMEISDLMEAIKLLTWWLARSCGD